MRANAVVYVSCLVLDGQIQSDDFDPKSVCSLMAKLLTDQVGVIRCYIYIYRDFVSSHNLFAFRLKKSKK